MKHLFVIILLESFFSAPSLAQSIIRACSICPNITTLSRNFSSSAFFLETVRLNSFMTRSFSCTISCPSASKEAPKRDAIQGMFPHASLHIPAKDTALKRMLKSFTMSGPLELLKKRCVASLLLRKLLLQGPYFIIHLLSIYPPQIMFPRCKLTFFKKGEKQAEHVSEQRLLVGGL